MGLGSVRVGTCRVLGDTSTGSKLSFIRLGRVAGEGHHIGTAVTGRKRGLPQQKCFQNSTDDLIDDNAC